MNINGIPKTEKLWVTYQSENGIIYYITSKQDRSIYFLYEFNGDSAAKIEKNKNPKLLEETIKNK